MPLPSFPPVAGLPKLLLPLLGVVVVIGGGALYLGKANEARQLQQALAQSRRQLTELQTHNSALTQKVTLLETSRKTLDENVSSLRKELAGAGDSLDQLKHHLNQLSVRYKTLEESRAALERQVTGVTAERDAARKDAEMARGEKSELERSVMRLRERLALLDRDYRQLSEQMASLQAVPGSSVSVISATGPVNRMSAPAADGAARPSGALSVGTVELPPIVVRKNQAGMSMPVRGRLVEVNDPHRFIVVDKGSQDGVRVGMVFNIIRGSATVGQATVVRVRPSLSACDILRAKTAGLLQVGDQAVQSGS